ncbi:MAG: prepilin-type cleavage/methylation domain-containing protein [Firmicutes bacterium HGW-Firmicutes-4]|jgi:type IV pilus assembly protein PilA|nr:MAG: prepilin-type cleavage/methylation domain-containing protein [Firmicutes bacterium HGW-Firmicutes-4]
MGSKSKLTEEQKITRLNNVRGFTMMEIIVVIAILGALAALAIPRFTGVLANSQEKTDLANIRIVESAVELYKAEKGEIDPAVDTFDELVTKLYEVGYLKNAELKAVSKGKIFTYNSATKQISLTTK